MAERALVGNAGDPEQVEQAGRKVKRRDQADFELTRHQLATPQGRAYVWRQLERFGIFDVIDGPMEQVYAANEAANQGRRLWRELVEYHGPAFLMMQQEALARRAQERRELEAVHTARATEKQTGSEP